MPEHLQFHVDTSGKPLECDLNQRRPFVVLHDASPTKLVLNIAIAECGLERPSSQSGH